LVAGVTARIVLLAAFLASLCLPGIGAWAADQGQINLNTATAKELQELPFIGEARATAIIRHRKAHGPFQKIEDLTAIEAIGPETFQAIAPYLTLDGPNSFRPGLEAATERPASGDFQVVPRIDTSPGQVVPLPDDRYFSVLAGFVDRASSSIEIGMFLFKTTDSPGNRAAHLVERLIAARKRGVRVTVVLEQSSYDDGINKENNEVARQLARAGVEVHLDGENRTSHAKLVVVDGRFVFLGSHNFTHSALASNHEFSVLIDSRTLATEISRYIQGLKARRVGR